MFSCLEPFYKRHDTFFSKYIFFPPVRVKILLFPPFYQLGPFKFAFFLINHHILFPNQPKTHIFSSPRPPGGGAVKMKNIQPLYYWRVPLKEMTKWEQLIHLADRLRQLQEGSCGPDGSGSFGFLGSGSRESKIKIKLKKKNYNKRKFQDGFSFGTIKKCSNCDVDCDAIRWEQFLRKTALTG